MEVILGQTWETSRPEEYWQRRWKHTQGTLVGHTGHNPKRYSVLSVSHIRTPSDQSCPFVFVGIRTLVWKSCSPDKRGSGKPTIGTEDARVKCLWNLNKNRHKRKRLASEKERPRWIKWIWPSVDECVNGNFKNNLKNFVSPHLVQNIYCTSS